MFRKELLSLNVTMLVVKGKQVWLFKFEDEMSVFYE